MNKYIQLIILYILFIAAIYFVICYPKTCLEIAKYCGLPAPIYKILSEFLPSTDFIVPEEYMKKKSGKFESKGEKECRRILQNKFNVPFINCKPNWLINPKTKRSLELDCYNEELKLALEYNGEYHYKYPNHTNCTEEKFKYQVWKDRIKRQICKDKGIYLIVVPYTVKHKDIENYINNKLSNYRKPLVSVSI